MSQSNARTYLICWRGSFWRGLAAGSGLLRSRTVAFPAWLWKNTTLEKKIDFSKIFSIPLWFKKWNYSSQMGRHMNLVTKGYLSIMQYRARTWPCSIEAKDGFNTGFTRGRSNESHNTFCNLSRSFSYRFFFFFFTFLACWNEFGNQETFK